MVFVDCLQLRIGLRGDAEVVAVMEFICGWHLDASDVRNTPTSFCGIRKRTIRVSVYSTNMCGTENGIGDSRMGLILAKIAAICGRSFVLRGTMKNAAISTASSANV